MSERSFSAPQLLTGLRLLAVLPPIGIAWLIYLSRWQWLQLLEHPWHSRHDPLLCFLGLLLVITGLNLNHHDVGSVLLSLLMLFVLLNLWLLCRQSTGVLSLQTLCNFIIQFGLYITISGNGFRWLNQIVTLPAWLKFLFGDLLWGYAANRNRLFGSAYNPNDACCLLLIALGLLLATLVNQATAPQPSKIVYRNWLIGGGLCLGIYQTKSRTGLAIMASLLLLTAYKLIPRHRAKLTAFLLLLSGGLWQWLPRTRSLTAAWQTRLTIWQNSFTLFKQAPWLGVTYFGFSHQYFRLTGTTVPHAHDIFLMVLASFGLLGGLGFLLLVFKNGYELTHHWRQLWQPNLRYFMITLPVILAYGLTDFVLSSLQVLIIILLFSAYWQRERQQPGLMTVPEK